MAGVRGPKGIRVPGALFDRCQICVGPIRATVDLVPRPVSKILEDLIFLIEPTADRSSDGVALPRPLIPH
jgi:hypothetical protein